MRTHLTVSRYCAAVIVTGCVVVALLVPTTNLTFVFTQPVTFGLLFAGLTLGELLPVKVPRRGGDEELTLSTSFTLALLLAGGLAPALLAQGLASALQDIISRKPWWRVLFNVAQYALSMSAALLVVRLLSADSGVGTSHPFNSSDLPAVLTAAATFFFVNTGVVGMAIALHQRVPIIRYFRNDAFFVLVTGSVLLCLAPIVIAATAYSPALLPLFAAPMMAIFIAGRQAVRSEHAATHDQLTHLPNRAAFRAAVNEALINDDAPRCCVLLMDLDRFKEVNDTLGHRYGDLLLEQVAHRLRVKLGEGSKVARLGGDEFAVFSEHRSRNAAVAFAERAADALRAPFELDDFVVDVQGSVGIALFPDDGNDVETLLQKADVAMYRAKETHSGVALYEESYDHHSPSKLALTADLRAAVNEEEIVVWYQPILDLDTDEVSAVEALVRWEHPDLGLLMPGSFIDMAEHTNLIKPLTQRVLDVALKQVAEWTAAEIPIVVAVNVSARVLVDRDFATRVLAALEKHGVAPKQLRLEVTESTLMGDPQTARTVLGELDGLGVEISIDDFGTGYSSLAYLADLPVSEVKIDRSFVTRMVAGSSEMIIVNSTINLAHHLGLRTVAEGVEDVSQLPQLRELGCDSVQGYGISRPLSPDMATRWLSKNKSFRAPRLLRSVG